MVAGAVAKKETHGSRALEIVEQLEEHHANALHNDSDEIERCDSCNGNNGEAVGGIFQIFGGV